MTAAETTTPEHKSQDSAMPEIADSPLPEHKSEDTLMSEYTLDRAGIWDRLIVSALRAEMYVGHVEGMDSPPPNATEEPNAIITANLPQWSSVMTVHEHYSYPEREPTS